MIRFALTFCAAMAASVAHAAVDIKQVTSPGGINAWLVEEHGIPFTALEIRFRGGTSLDAPEKRGAIKSDDGPDRRRHGRSGQSGLFQGARFPCGQLSVSVG